MTLQASVVVPTHGRPELLRRCLHELLAQDLDPATYEIIVADDGASAATRAIVSTIARDADAHGPHACVRYVPVCGRHGPAAARNTGWRAARAPIIAFTDDDCLPAPCWLRAGINSLSDGAVAA